MSKTDMDQKDVVTNGADPSVDGLKKLQDAISAFANDDAGSGPMKELLVQLSSYVGEVSQKLDTLNAGFDVLSIQLGAMSDANKAKLEGLDDKMVKVCSKLNIRLTKPGAGTFPAAAAKSTGSSSTTSGSTKGVPAAPVAETPEEAVKKYPNLQLVWGNKDPWSFNFEFEFRVGDITFHSLEQAMYYIKYAYMKRPDLMTRIKKGHSTSDFNHVGQIASSKEWEGVMHDVGMSLLQLKCQQCKDFEDVVQAGDPKVTYLQAGNNQVLSMGCPRASIPSKLPDKFPGKNQFGAWLKEFVELYQLGLPNELPFDVKEYCSFKDATIPQGALKVLVLADLQMNGFKDKLKTKLIVDPTMSGVEHPKDESHTAKKILSDVENVTDYGVIVLLFGTYEVGKSPDKLESDYTALLKAVRSTAPDALIVVGNALPRTDKFSDQVKLTNYAIGIATRTAGDDKVLLVDLNEKFEKLGNLKSLLKPNGFHLNEAGADKLAEILATSLPFVDVSAPKKPQVQQSPAGKQSAASKSPRGGGPAAKRARRSNAVGTYSQRGTGRGYSSHTYSGPVAATPGYASSPWAIAARSANTGMYSMSSSQASSGWPRSYDY